MALLKKEQLGDALLLIYGGGAAAAAAAIPVLGHLWRETRVCISPITCAARRLALTRMSPTHL